MKGSLVMLSFLFKKCYFCNQRIPRKEVRHYVDDVGKKINVCEKCVIYAERRALRKA